MNREIEKTVVHVPERPVRTTLGKLGFALGGPALVPVYWGLATLRPPPGMDFRARCFALGLRALAARRKQLPLSTVFHLLFMPMESTRYFEFDFAWRNIASLNAQRYLDVSSPRLLPLSLMLERPGLKADLINPNGADLAETARFAAFVDGSPRCTLHPCLIADAPFAPATFDLITSISVLEHIPDDLEAVRRMWNLLKPGGTLLLTVPCMARAVEQYIDRNDWGLLQQDRDGLVFWQRLYDRALLEERIFGVTGRPSRVELYGEKTKGALARNSERKRSDPYYPYWREPYMMGSEYTHFDRLEDLPGEGVAGMVFVKP